MKSEMLLELLHLANELEYHFFISDQSMTSWFYASTPFLRMMRISEDELLADPQCWISRVDGTPGSIVDKFGRISGEEEELQIELPLVLAHGDKLSVQFRFTSLQEVEDKLCRFGSAVFLTDNDLYKKEAIQSRDNEIEISARIQKALLTGEIGQSGQNLVIAGETLPSHKVDGDFYEFLWLTPDIADFIIGDVMGKGVPAALLAAGIKSSFFKVLITQGAVSGRLPEIRKVLGDIDSTINRDLIDLEKFLTLYYCRLDMSRLRLSFIDAGHTGFIYHNAEENSCWSVKGADMPLGFTLNQDFQEFILPLAKDDLLFFYSDGLSEVRNTEGDLFGLDRIMQLIQAHCHLEPVELIRKVMNVTFFFAAREFEDDITAISIRVKKSRNLPIDSRFYIFENTEGIDMALFREEISYDLERIYPSISSETTTKFLIAIMEVLGNCISYTNSFLEIQWRMFNEEAVINFSFTGSDFDWFKKSLPDIERFQQGGYGYYLIDQGTDSALLLYGRNEKKRIVLIKGME